MGRTGFATEVFTKVFYGENLFCRQSLAKRVKPVSDHADHDVISTVYQTRSEGPLADVRPRRPGGGVAHQSNVV